MSNSEEEKYWTQRHQEGHTGWDIGAPSTPLKTYVDQLSNKKISILIPGAGNAYEAEYLFAKGFKNTFVMDLSEIPLAHFKKRNPDFPTSQLLQENFFDHKTRYDLILEQTFFCSFIPTDANRSSYAEQMANLLKNDGKLVGVWFDIPLTEDLEKRPFGGNKELYLRYLSPYLNVKTFEKCYNSIAPRMGNELFGIFQKK